MCVCVSLTECVLDGIIEALGHPQKERLKHEDTNISNWLQGYYVYICEECACDVCVYIHL